LTENHAFDIAQINLPQDLAPSSVASWPGEEGLGSNPPPLNFGLLENFVLVEKFSSKNAQFGAENSYFGEI